MPETEIDRQRRDYPLSTMNAQGLEDVYVACTGTIWAYEQQALYLIFSQDRQEGLDLIALEELTKKVSVLREVMRDVASAQSYQSEGEVDA